MKINAVFEGGGIKGLAYVGVLRFLEKEDFVSKKSVELQSEPFLLP